MWPNSPAMPSRPRTSFPSSSIPGADSFRHRHHDHVRRIAQFSKPALGEQAGVGGILHHDGSLQRFFEIAFEIALGPGRMGRKHQAVRLLVDTARNAHAHALDHAPAKGGADRPRRAADRRDRGSGIRFRSALRGELNGFAAQNLAVDIDHRQVSPARPEIDGQRDVLVVQGDKGGPTAARQAAQGSRRHPPFFDQLPDDERDGAGLQAGEAGEVGAAHRLARMNGAQHDVPIDLARRLA